VPCTLISAGKALLKKSSLSGQPAIANGVIEESIHTSHVELSPISSPPHFGHFSTCGFSFLGSTGSLLLSAGKI
jgi:hypothetical protein